MKTLALIMFILFLALINTNVSQTRYISSSPDFEDHLENTSVTTIVFNENNESYNYNNSTLNLAGVTKIIEFRRTNINNTITLSNITFNNCGIIKFRIRHNVVINIENSCNFNFSEGGGIIFTFDRSEDLYPAGNESNITIKNSDFNLDWDNPSLSLESSNQLLFFKKADYPDASYIKKEIEIKNITVENCTLTVNNNRNIVSETNTITAISFNRDSNYVHCSNIEISDCKIDFDMDGSNTYSPRNGTSGINFSNLNSTSNPNQYNCREYNTQAYYYSYNKNIDIINNILETNSKNPKVGIFVQGPFEDVDLINNQVYKFGLNYWNGSAVHSDGAIHLYGARASVSGNELFYSDDIKDILLKDNTVTSYGTAINIIGAKVVRAENNSITLLDWNHYSNSPYNFDLTTTDRLGLHIATGDYKDAVRQTSQIIIYNNNIYCNGEEGTIGILAKGINDFHIYENYIYKPNTAGILYWGNDGMEYLNIGEAIIEKNEVDFNSQTLDDLNSYFYLKNYGNNLGGISFLRLDNGEDYSDEFLYIRNNDILNTTNIPFKPFLDETESYINYWLGAGFNGGPWNIGDFNGDGKDDIMCPTSTNYGAKVWFSNGSNFSNQYQGTWLLISNNGQWYIGDFNGDGKDDIMCPTSTNYGAKVWFSNGSNFSNQYQGIWLSESNNGQWYIGDFNGDGKDDIMCPTSTNYGAKVWFSNGSNFSNQYQGVWLDFANNGNWYIGDFDGTDEDDILGQLNQYGGSIVHLSYDYNGQMNKNSSNLETNNHFVEVPNSFELFQNYPNPFNPQTTISFSLRKNGYVRLDVFNSLGQKVITLINEIVTAGIHQRIFNASELSSGMYYYRIDTEGFSQTKKMILIK